MIELAALSDPAQIIPALAQVFGLQESPFNPLAAVVTEALRDKNLLIILDNCEHLIAACARLADDLLHHCMQVKILASSREALGIAGEMAYRIPPLADSESTRLFMERARASNAKLSLAGSDASSVAQICSRLDGIPLAIELAAARTNFLSIDQIAARLDKPLQIVDRRFAHRPAPPANLACIDRLELRLAWRSGARTFCRRLSVFSGGWTLEAAEFVCPKYDVMEFALAACQ